MGELATVPEDRARYLKDGFQVTDAKMVDQVTAVIVDLEKDKSLYPKDWVIPGANAVSAALDFARVICRRAERQVATLKDPNPEILRYLNRLSDFWWLLARYSEKRREQPNSASNK
jgi:cob(I)alamin adenosyltransferase